MKIVTDSAADMTQEESAALGIEQAPLTIHLPDREITSAQIGSDEFYNLLTTMYPSIPTTSQPSAGLFTDIYHRLAAEDRDILSVHISSGLSGTYNSALVGSERARDQASITVVDSMTLSGGERFQVLAAAWAARAAWPIARILERLDQIRSRTETIFTLETVDYLARGGRIGRISALAGTLLKIKPIIRVDHADGKYSQAGRTRSVPKALEDIASHLSHLYGSTPVWASILHGQFPDAAATLGDLIKRGLNVASIETRRVSPVLGVHTGPAVAGVAVVPAELLQDLVPA